MTHYQRSMVVLNFHMCLLCTRWVIMHVDCHIYETAFYYMIINIPIYPQGVLPRRLLKYQKIKYTYDIFFNHLSIDMDYKRDMEIDIILSVKFLLMDMNLLHMEHSKNSRIQLTVR